MAPARSKRLLYLTLSLTLLGFGLVSCGSQEGSREAAQQKAPPAAAAPATPGAGATASKTATEYVDQGREVLKSKQYDQAITSFNEALKLDPKSIPAYNNRGIAFCEKGDFDKAIADFSQVIEIDPNNGKAYNNRAVAYLMKGERVKALQDVEKAQSLGITVNQMLIDSLKPAEAKAPEKAKGGAAPPGASPAFGPLPPGVSITPIKPEDLPKPGSRGKPEAQGKAKPKSAN